MTTQAEAQAAMQQALAWARAGNLAPAEARARALASAYPGNVNLLHQAGCVLQLAGRHDDALGLFHAALRLLPDFHYTEMEVGNTLLALHRPAEAAEWYLKAADSAPDSALAWRRAGQTLHALGEPARALEALRQAQACDPGDAEVAAALAELLPDGPGAPAPAGAIRAENPVGMFTPEALPRAADMAALLAAIAAPLPGRDEGLTGDLWLVHAAETTVRALPRGYAWGHTVFGCGRSIGEPHFALNRAHVRRTETAILHHAIYSPQSAAVMRPGAGFYAPSLVNQGETLDSLVAIDPLYERDAGGAIRLSALASGVATLDAVAMPVCGTGFPNYGHFLFDGLPFAFLLASLVPEVRIALIGPRLSPWHTEIVTALGLIDRYRAVDAATRVRRLIVSNTVAQHVAYPSRLIRPMLDTLRYRLAAPGAQRRRIFVSRRNLPPTRLLDNRDEVEASLADMGFEIVTPEALSFPDQVRLFAACDLVIGESGAAMANVAFCDPGTTILEIQPETFFEGWTRATCMVLALEWNVYFARASARTAQGLTYTVDVPTLRAAVAAVIGRMIPKT